MPIKVERRDGTPERRVLVGMCVSKAVLGPIADRWTPGMFASRWANLVAGWCVTHYRKFRRPPGPGLVAYLESWVGSGRADKDVVPLVEAFLETLSDEYDRVKRDMGAPDHLLDVAAELFERVQLGELRMRIEACLEAGDVAKARALVDASRKVEIGVGAGVDLLADESAVENAFELRGDDLIEYPGAAGNFFKGALGRDCFVSFLGKEKVGKSFWLEDVAWRAVGQGRNVAYFECGDMSQHQVVRRFAARACGRPVDAGRYEYPTRLDPSGSDKDPPVVETEVRHARAPLGPGDVSAAFGRVADAAGGSRLRLSCHPTASVSVSGIEAVLDGWERDGWSPDVVCIAQGSQVLTDRGPVPIEFVRNSDRLWDGRNWVTHGGRVYKGIRRVITYAGLTATPDHLVYTDRGWRTLVESRRLGLRIAKTGLGGKSLRLGPDSFTHRPGPQVPVPEVRAHLRGGADLRPRPVCAVCRRKVGGDHQSVPGAIQRLSEVFTAQAFSDTVVAAVGSRPPAVRKSQAQGMEVLRWSGDQIQVPVGVGRVCVDRQESGFPGSGDGTGSDRQRRALRTRQHSVVNPPAEHRTHPEEPAYTPDAQVPDFVPPRHLRGFDAAVFFQEGVDPGADRHALEVHPSEVWESPVWDVVNAGPFHRFTVQGLLVHNCVDYADILAPIDPRVEPFREQINMTWKALRGLSQKKHCLVVTATQADADSYTAWRLSRENFSEDKRKLSHVSGMVGINQTQAEKDRGLYRLNWVLLRELDFSESKCLWCASALGAADPCVLSCF